MKELIRSGFFKINPDIVETMVADGRHIDCFWYVKSHSKLNARLVQDLIDTIVKPPTTTEKRKKQ